MSGTGHCLCGRVRYEFDGEPDHVTHCHCDSCRRQTGSPIATFAIIGNAALRFTAGQPKEFASSPGVWRSFCDNCGSPIYYRTSKRPDVVDVFVGTLSDPGTVAPTFHVFCDEQLPWFEVLDELPRYPGSRWGEPATRTGPRRT